MATSISNPLVTSRTPFQGSKLKAIEQSMGSAVPTNLSFGLKHPWKSSVPKRELTVRATFGDGGRSNSGNLFIGGFILGGLFVGTLGCVYAPQISKALAGTDKKEIMRKLPKFIYDEDKALEKQRKKLTEKIEQLSSAIDDVSNQLRSENTPNGEEVKSVEVEALA